MARRQGMMLSVLASPMGARLYAKLGFAFLAKFIVQAEDDAEFVILSAMAYGEERTGVGA